MAHSNKQPPGEVIPHVHDERGWRSGLLKSYFKKAGKPTSLKLFARTTTDPDCRTSANNWFHNKRVNTSLPQQGVGNTRK